MKIIDATPPADFPVQVIVLDKGLGKQHPSKGFYLRVAVENGVETVDLDGAITPLDARKIAKEKGFEPTHWMEVTDIRPTMF
ncbi:hypothetical protein [Burkholderia ubonensis]|uniref:Uncharacterized protein n=1 Tax=Burkholderia ubonensis subsp. mesacidophila TaxID=265293 RepID=A0A2A4FDC9_9BURK|nr:hypothetical protein [Burkholderia ubonensis]PCE30349.1 hypothetical protein BZL54_21905 [Burkholderia ubonensis subsp. mesacidophila]